MSTTHSLASLLLLLLCSCGLNDLEDRVNTLENKTDSIENTLGHDSPMYINYSVTNGPDGAYTHTDVFNFNGSESNTVMYDKHDKDSLYYVYIEKSSSITLEEYASIAFLYDARNKSFTQVSVFINIIDSKAKYRYHVLTINNAQFTINLKELDLENGKIDLEVSSHFVFNQLENCSFRFIYSGKISTLDGEFHI